MSRSAARDEDYAGYGEILERLTVELDEAVAALREIKRAGVKFDARGTHSRWVVERAEQALSKIEGVA